MLNPLTQCRSGQAGFSLRIQMLNQVLILGVIAEGVFWNMNVEPSNLMVCISKADCHHSSKELSLMHRNCAALKRDVIKYYSSKYCCKL